jgi:hypothetical protein
MKRIALLSAITLVATIASTGAYALANRTFVSGSGSDANPCSLAAPCRSFAGAILQTSPGGEIAVLDTAGYGAVTITKAVSIVNEEGVEAGVTTSAAGDAITITAGATDVVNLHGLTLVGGGVGTNGITINSAGSVNIQNTVIRGFTQNGINMVVTGSGTSNLSVIDTTVSNNTNGVLVQPAGDNLTGRAVFKRVQAIGNTAVGLLVVGGAGAESSHVKSTAIDTLASGNGVDGFAATATSGLANSTDFELINCQAVENGTGVLSNNATVNIFLAQTTIADNPINGYDNSGGTIWSFGNNYIAPNNTNHGSLAPIGQQ